MNQELLILTNLLCNEQYVRKVTPFLKSEYFTEFNYRIIFDELHAYINKYNSLADKNILYIELEKRTDLTDDGFQQVKGIIESIICEEQELPWLLDTTEKWCQERAIYLALMESIKIADGQDDKKDKGSIPHVLTEALGVSFDTHIGHDYISDSEERYETYHKEEQKIPFDLDLFNKVTKGGLPNKTLNVALAGTGVGKSLFMCHVASSVLLQGKNVLYITLEMAEEKIAERIDANLLNVNIQDLKQLPKVMFDNKIGNLQKKTQGKVIIKEYPTAGAHTGHFRALINDLKLKKNFTPDIIFVDYLNICASSRYRSGTNINSYTLVKSIAEELRGLAVEFNLPIVSATQTTRAGFGSSDPDLTDTSESFGLPATADLMFALISTEELESQNRLLVKQLKNRYNDPTSNRKFLIGIDRSKMRLYDVAEDTSVLNADPQEEEMPQFSETKNRLSKFAEWNV